MGKDEWEKKLRGEEKRVIMREFSCQIRYFSY